VDVWAFGLLVHYMLFREYYFIANSESLIKKRVLGEEYKLKNHHKDLVSDGMADFLTKCLKFNKKDRLKAQELSRHPVFDKVRAKVEMIMQSVIKTSDIEESGLKKAGPKGRLINFITSFNFIFDFAGKLSSQNPYLIAILYLHKFNYSELTSIKRFLEKG
jgi:serine/threonine protein kinase